MLVADIGVVIPVLDGARYLGEAIESALTQTLPPSEIVVVDHGSTDYSLQVARSFSGPVRTLSAVRRHLGPPRNEGIEATTTPLLAFLDADDRWAADKLEHQVDQLSAPGDPDLVFGQVEEFASPELLLVEPSRTPRPRQPAPLMSLLLLRRTTFERVGPFREDVVAAELDWLARARQIGVTESYPEGATLHRRIHATNSSRRPALTQGALRVLAERNAARRAGRG